MVLGKVIQQVAVRADIKKRISWHTFRHTYLNNAPCEWRKLAPESGGQIPAIALTGYAASVDEFKAYAAGYQVHITKPVALRELAKTVAKLSGRQSAPHMSPAHS